MIVKHPYDKVIYLLQGGGALGTYQSSVCQGLLEFGCEPDWVIGTSIGAINAAIIVGNPPEQRIEKLKEFWDIVAPPTPFWEMPSLFNLFSQTKLFKEYENFVSAQFSSLFGQPGFFKPRYCNPWFEIVSTPDKLSYYDTSELKSTLNKVIDFDLINQKKVRLSLGSVNVKTGTAVHFDNSREKINPEHIMASCALPPGFPAIKIGEDYYWDGGILSNTPLKVILEEKIPQKLLCFVIHLYSFPDHLPTSMMDVMSSRKDLEYASHYTEILKHFSELHALQHSINGLSKTTVGNQTLESALELISETGHPAALNIVRFHYKTAPDDLWSSDFNFSPLVLKKHWQAGYDDVHNALQHSNWLNETFDGIHPIIHEF